MAPAPTSTENITPPRSSHGYTDSWGYAQPQKEDLDDDMNTTNHDYTHKNHYVNHNGNSNVSYHSSIERAGRKRNSHDNLSSGKHHNSVDGAAGSHHSTESKKSPILDEGNWPTFGPHQNGDEYSRNAVSVERGPEDENSKWIHRDKLARIESEELQAAGIFIPRTRNHSKQRRDRSRSAMRRGTDASEHSHAPRSRKNSTAVESRNHEPVGESWDLRTPEEIAEEEANAYFTPNNHKGGSRIPVAKVSPAPIPVDCFERGSAAVRKTSESPDGESTLTNYKTRPGSAHMRGSDTMSVNSMLPAPKRSATDMSPKKAAAGVRKTSGPSKTGTATGRPKTRSGSIGGSNSTRPSTRSGELSPGNKAPEGDPPWMVNAYKPDPRLPPDQQLLPTVARRLQQEKWEKEGKFGDVYDKDFRPLNDHALLKPQDGERAEDQDDREKEKSPTEDEWPLKLEPTKSPTQRQGGYSTMPKISDKHHSPLPSPRTPVAPHTPHAPPQEEPKPEPTQAPVQQPPAPADDDSKGGCGCCVVM
ncbi:hypothetical protein FALBO_1250 [Fusarium albosuccineum]|uniref:TeaA receptor TeaR n=1 Tax=Fusarium albosuccineum TaxID=1237068 RepID=A0A8H4PGG5_9HYPO|nr:hypothetical protein FALBO_1250 [Fusarium albosuccineum]